MRDDIEAVELSPSRMWPGPFECIPFHAEIMKPVRKGGDQVALRQALTPVGWNAGFPIKCPGDLPVNCRGRVRILAKVCRFEAAFAKIAGVMECPQRGFQGIHHKTRSPWGLRPFERPSGNPCDFGVQRGPGPNGPGVGSKAGKAIPPWWHR